LPLECEKEETWGKRLLIAKKGGGHHYSDQERELADAAYGRVGVLYDYCTASSQLAGVAERLPRLMDTLGAQKHLSKLQRVEKCAAALAQALGHIERLGGGADAGACERLRRRVGQGRLPDTLPNSLLMARRALPAMLAHVLALCEDEHRLWAAEAGSKQRFRTPHTHALLHAATEMADSFETHGAVVAHRDEVLGYQGDEKNQLGAKAANSSLCERLSVLREREKDLQQAADAATAALARDEYDESV
jgi:hypothetical protein